jgi:hypothetical protein
MVFVVTLKQTQPAPAAPAAQSGATITEGAACIPVAAAYVDAHTCPLAAGIDGQTPGVSTASEATRSSDELSSSQHGHSQTDVRANGHWPDSPPTPYRAMVAAPTPSAATATRLQALDLPPDSQPTPTVATTTLPPAPESPPATHPTSAAASDAAGAVGTNTLNADDRSDYEVSAFLTTSSCMTPATT